MKLPPALARLRYGDHKFWLPIFLLWPLIVPLFALIVLAGLIALPLMEKHTLRGFGRFLSGAYETLCALRGALIEVEESQRSISLTIY